MGNSLCIRISFLQNRRAICPSILMSAFKCGSAVTRPLAILYLIN
ncbi:hypothetical protein B4069_1645 [Bacillus subtilis]|nr:hypothetical protein B4069_1645 [Bacillus subtilis]